MIEISTALHLIWAYSQVNWECMEEYIYYIVSNTLGGILKDNK